MAMGAGMKALLATLFLLGGCAQQWVPQEREVKLHILNRGELHEQYREHGGKRPVNRGFMLLKSEPCEIWVTPRGLLSTTFLHEVKHCDLGKYH